MAIKFITGNSGKFTDAKSVIPYLEQVDFDLLEIQELDPKKIIEEKLREAQKHHEGEFIVEDVSLRVEGLNGLPGPLIKWFLKSVGAEGIAKMASESGNAKAVVSTIYGFIDAQKNITYFDAEAAGTVVAPRGTGGFGWDPIFQPEGSTQTYAEWKETNPGANTMRLEALGKLKTFLDKHHGNS